MDYKNVIDYNKQELFDLLWVNILNILLINSDLVLYFTLYEIFNNQ